MAWPFGGKQGANDEEQKKELDAFIDRIGTSFEAKLEEKLKPIREEVTSVKTKWEALEKAAGGNGDAGNGGGGGEGSGGNGDENLTDEQKRQVNDRKMLALTIATNARITEGEVLGEVVGQGLSEYVPKIKEYYQNTPLERKGQADYAEYCRNIVNMIVGKVAREQGLRFDGQNKKFFLEDAGGKGSDSQYDFLAGDQAWVDPRSGRIVSASEQLAKLGIKPEEFAESIKKGVV
jgi:hypothetical protein